MRKIVAFEMLVLVALLIMATGCGSTESSQSTDASEDSEQSVTITSRSQVDGSSVPRIGGRSTSWDDRCKEQADGAIETMQVMAESYLNRVEGQKLATAQEYRNDYDEYERRLQMTVSSTDSSFKAYEDMGCDSSVTSFYSEQVHEAFDGLIREMSDTTERRVAEVIGGMPSVQKPVEEKGVKAGGRSKTGDESKTSSDAVESGEAGYDATDSSSRTSYSSDDSLDGYGTSSYDYTDSYDYTGDTGDSYSTYDAV